MKEKKIGMGRRGKRFLDEGREWGLPGHFYADYLVMCGESEKTLRAMVGSFVKVYRRRGLKFNAGESKVMALNGEEGLECV